MKFSIFSTMFSAGELASDENFSFFVTDPKVSDLCKQIRQGNKELKKDLPAVCWHAYFPSGKRKNSEAVSSGLYMLDLDHMKNAREYGFTLAANDPLITALGIYVIHVTPSGEGLRIVAKALSENGFKTISENQHWLARQLHIDEIDEATKDLARLSYLVPEEDFIYLNRKIFEDEKEIDLANGKGSHGDDNSDNSTLQVSEEVQTAQKDYRGIPFERIAGKYFELTGGEPKVGDRNSKLYSYARDLRYLCDFNPAVMERALPSYGLPKQEMKSIISHALESTRASQIPQIMKNVLAALDSEQQTEKEVNIKLPKQLPPVIKEFVDIAPTDFKIPTTLAILPVLGTVFTKLRSEYLDGNMQSPSLMCVVEAPQASGKSFTRNIVDICLKDIRQQDDIERAKEQAYREQVKLAKNKKDQPSDPRAVVRIIPASVSIAKLLQRMDYAECKHLFSFCEELDTMIKSNKAGSWSQKSDIYRNAFDNAVYGQDYMSDTTYSANLNVYYNILVCGTPASVRRFFNNSEDGLISRFIFCELKDQFGQEMPIFKKLSEAKISLILTRLRECENLVDQSGEIKMPLVKRFIKKWLEDQRLIAIREVSHSRDIFRRRAAVIAFRAAMVAFALYKFERKSEKYCRDFAIFVANCVLNAQIQKYGSEIDQSEETRAFRGNNVFRELEDIFSAEDVAAKMRKARLRTPARTIISIWKTNGLVEKIDKNKFKKVKS